MRTIRLNWHDRKQLARDVTPEQVLDFGKRVSHFCPSRWNTIVSAIRFVTPHGELLKRRRVRLLHFIPPPDDVFKTFLEECDKAKARGSHAGIVVRFLVLSSMRFSEAYRLEKAYVFPDRIEVPSAVSKNGKARTIPLIPGLHAVIDELKQITEHSPYLLPRGNPKKAIASAAKRCGFKWSFHRCRHLFGTRAVECGVDVPTIARWFGHQDGGALLSRGYFHLLDRHSRRMAGLVQIAA